MKPLSFVFNSLKKNKYFTSFNIHKSQVVDLQFATNGLAFQTELLKKWHKTTVDWANTEFLNDKFKEENVADCMSRFTFCNFQKFREYWQYYANKSLHPSIVKFTMPCIISSENFIQLRDSPCTLLISDYFINAADSLEKFYSLQRERKIWWMRCSANPSRYSLEVYQPEFNSVDFAHTKDCQSITIKSKFSFSSIDVETITLMQITNNTNNQYIIRSTIVLEIATCAMLLDAIENNNKHENVLMLNRKLAPFQCFLINQYEDTNDAVNNDIKDLGKHIRNVLQRTGLRMYENDEQIRAYKIENIYSKCDNIGIPYTISIGSDSLKTGFLKLRNRDTTLVETIHITDIPHYILQIFKS